MSNILFITAIINWMVALAAVFAGIHLIKKIDDIEKRVKHLEYGSVDLDELMKDIDEDNDDQ